MLYISGYLVYNFIQTLSLIFCFDVFVLCLPRMYLLDHKYSKNSNIIK